MRNPLPLAGLMSLCALITGAARAETFSATAVTGADEYYLSESFPFHIQVQGSDSPDKPDLSALVDFVVQEV